jgi:hypothetical protein
MRGNLQSKREKDRCAERVSRDGPTVVDMVRNWRAAVKVQIQSFCDDEAAAI